MARIDYVDPNAASDKVRQLLERNAHKNIFRMMGHSESHLHNYCRLGHAIRHKGELDPGLRELAITRTGILCESDYEVRAHKRIARSVGVPEAKIEALEHGADATVYDPREQAVLRFTDEVVRNVRPSDASFQAVAAFLSPGELVELHLAIGYYIMTSKFLNAFDIDPQR
ncbi:MAG: carboxymuconolactone decarboxylase family protein [Gammaproteobacteria bacterium]|nr:carboxymuconolactone decarboxylase family protein [Gammaproteobacteria bacterium]